MFFRWLLTYCFLSVLILSNVALAQQTRILSPEIDGRSLSLISFRNWTNLNYDDLVSSLPIKLGSILTEQGLQQSIGELYRRDIFQHVDVKVTATQQGVEVEFLLSPSLLISNVEFHGNKSISTKLLKRFASIRQGMHLNYESLYKAKQKIEREYIKAGYYTSNVNVKITQRRIAPYVSVHFWVDENYLSKLREVEINGVFPEDIKHLRELFLGEAIGSDASESSLKKLTKKLLLALRNEGYLEAYVRVQKRHYQKLSGDVDISVDVETGKPLSIVFSGNKHFSAEQLLDPLKMNTRTVPFSASAIPNLVTQIQALYQQHGYFFATVTYKKLPNIEERRRFEITIDARSTVRLETISFDGNNSLDKDKLLGVMQVTPAGFGILKRWKPGFITENQILSSVDAIRSLYEQTGFIGTTVNYELKHDSSLNRLELVIKIHEAPRKAINSAKVIWKNFGTKKLDLSSSKLLTIRPDVKIGDVLNIETIKQARSKLSDDIAACGYPNSSVELFVNPTSGDIRFEVDAGIRVKVGKITNRGNVFTHDYVINRALTLSSGSNWEPTKIQNTERALYKLGLFRSVSVGPIDGILDSSVEDMFVEIAERDTGSFEFGGDVSTEDGLHLIAGIRQRNFRGSGSSVALGVDGYFRSGNRLFDAGRATATATIPHILNTELELYNEAFLQSSFQHVDVFSFDRIGVAQHFRYPVSEHLRAVVGYTAFQENVSDVPEDIVADENDTGKTFYTVLNSKLELDVRDDIFNTTYGMHSIIEARLASEALGSDVDYYGLSFGQSVFLPISTWLVWANNAQFNFFRPLGSTNVIPLSQRFFLGGRHSLRGFSPNAIGPRGIDKNIAGGDVSINASTELRFEVTESIGWVLFLDTGQAALKEAGSFLGDTKSLTELRFSPGIGLHYKTPIGPLGVEYGVALDREFGERFGRFNLSIGNAF